MVAGSAHGASGADEGVIVYVKQGDPYSVRACTLLRMKEVVFETRDVSHYAEEMIAVTGSPVAPQIVIHGRAIGDFEALGSLELRGELDRLLNAEAAHARRS